jgi:hypothetical protein
VGPTPDWSEVMDEEVKKVLFAVRSRQISCISAKSKAQDVLILWHIGPFKDIQVGPLVFQIRNGVHNVMPSSTQTHASLRPDELKVHLNSIRPQLSVGTKATQILSVPSE